MAEQLTEHEKVALAAQGYEDPVFFCKTFLSHLFPSEIPWFHRAIFAILLRRTNFLSKYGELDKIEKYFGKLFRREGDSLRLVRRKYTLIMLPRGFSKTTIAGIAVPMMHVLYRDIDFGLYVSETGTHAKMQLENVKNELANNELIIAVFGQQRPSLSDDQRWAADFFETLYGSAFAARGRGAQIRGVNHHGRRPKHVILDDLEDEESVETEEQRSKTKRWFFGAVKPALNKMDGDASIVFLCTLLHDDALPATLMYDKQWAVVKFGAIVDEVPLWPEMMDLDAIEAEKESYALAGMLHQFYLEYFNESRPSDLAKFRKDFFIRAPVEGQIIGTALYCDPAISKKKTADDTVMAVVSISSNGKLYIRDMFGRRGVAEREMVDKYFDFARIYSPTRYGFESNGFQAAIVYLIREEMFRKKLFFEVEPVTHTNRKSERILGILQPRYANGYIVHCGSFPKLESQLLDYRPDVEMKDDWPDAVAGAVALLLPYAAAASETDLEDETEFEDIDGVVGEAWYH